MAAEIKLSKAELPLTKPVVQILNYLDDVLGEIVAEGPEVPAEKVQASTVPGITPSPDKRERYSGLFRLFSWALTKMGSDLLPKQMREIPSDIIYLSPPQHEIFVKYRSFLNQHFIFSRGLTHDAATATEIRSTTILMKEILLRFGGYILQTDVNQKHKGDALLSALEKFIRKVNESDLLYERGRISELNILLAREHKEWVSTLKCTFESAQMQTHHIASLNAAIKLLTMLKRNLQRFILMKANPRITRGELDEQFLDLALVNQEKSYLRELEKGQRLTQLPQESKQDRLLRMRRMRDKLSQELDGSAFILYRLFDKVDAALDGILCTHKMIDFAGWLHILTGSIRMKNIGELVKTLYAEYSLCVDKIVLPHMKVHKDQPCMSYLIKCLDIPHLVNIETTVNDLFIFHDPTFCARVLESYVENFAQLCKASERIEESMGHEYMLVNHEIVDSMSTIEHATRRRLDAGAAPSQSLRLPAPQGLASPSSANQALHARSASVQAIVAGRGMHASALAPPSAIAAATQRLGSDGDTTHTQNTKKARTGADTAVVTAQDDDEQRDTDAARGTPSPGSD